MGKKQKNKAVNNGLQFLLKYFSYAIGIPLLMAIIMTRLDHVNSEKEWPISSAYYGIFNYENLKGGSRKKQKGGNKNVPFPFALDDPNRNNIIQYLGSFFKNNWFNFRKDTGKVIQDLGEIDSIASFFKIKPFEEDNLNMWLPWSLTTWKNIIKMAFVYYIGIFFILSYAIYKSIVTTISSIFDNTFLTIYKKNKEKEGSVWKYWFVIICIFWFMFLGVGSIIWAPNITIQILLFLFYIFISPMQHVSSFKKHLVNIFNFRGGKDDKTVNHGFLKWLLFTFCAILIGFISNDWLRYYPEPVYGMGGVLIFGLFLYFRYH